MKKISIEVGHGGRDPGAVRGSILEKDINLVVALELDKQLKNHGVHTLMSRTADVDDPAREFYTRAIAFNPDIGIAIHTNAFNGTARGFEVFRNTNNFRDVSHSLCVMIEAEVRALGQSSRGVKDSPFIMSNLQCPTAFLELGFLDNPVDFAVFDTPEKQKKFATAYAKGILRFLGIKWGTLMVSSSEPPFTPATPQPQNNTLWRVVAGSFRERANAEIRVAELRRLGVDGFVMEHIISGGF
jgi:N-acetylmuramoyl-L-alanine amidase